jgi:hypothetical protein
MIMRKKTVLVVAALSVLSGAFLLSRREGTPKGSTQDAQAAGPVRGDSPKGRCDFEVGEELAYTLSIQSDAIVQGDRMGASGSAPVRRKVEAKLTLEALSTSGFGAVLLARFSPIQVDGKDGKLDEPFLLRVHDCRVQGFARHTRTLSAQARTVQGLAYELGFVNVPSAETRRVEGDDSAGHYRAVFAGDGSRVTRHIEAYTTLWDGSAISTTPGAEIRPRESASTFTLDDGKWFASLTRHEVLSGVAAADTDQTLNVQRASVDDALSEVDRNQDHYVWENLLPRVAFRRAKREVTRRDLEAQKAVKNHSLEEELSDFVVRSRSLPNFAETWPPLATYLEARPEMTRPLAHALRAGVVPPEGRAGGWLAIGNARTEEAKAVLLETMRDPTALAINRTRAMFAMVDRDDVGAELTREMASQALAMSSASDNEGRFFARESALAMGMMAGLRGEAEPDVLEVALSTTRQLLVSQKTANDLHPVFGSIANIGHPSMLALARPYTYDPDAKVRAGAALVFRRLSPMASNDFVAEWLGRETDLTVKRELYTTLWKQSHDARMAVSAAVLDRAIADLAAKPPVITRRAIIKLLGEAASTYLPARRALMAQAPLEAKQRTGLYTVIAQYLGADDLSAGLAQGQVGP